MRSTKKKFFCWLVFCQEQVSPGIASWVMSMTMSTYYMFIYEVSRKNKFLFLLTCFCFLSRTSGSPEVVMGHVNVNVNLSYGHWPKKKFFCFLFLFCWHVVMLTSGSSLVFVFWDTKVICCFWWPKKQKQWTPKGRIRLFSANQKLHSWTVQNSEKCCTFCKVAPSSPCSHLQLPALDESG